jgi:hypothetical protein
MTYERTDREATRRNRDHEVRPELDVSANYWRRRRLDACADGNPDADPEYVAVVHSHPQREVLHILDGVAEAWIDGRED